MKIYWDKKYLKISLYVVFTLVVTYAIVTLIDGAAFIISDIVNVVSSIASFIGSILSLFSPLIIALVIAYLLDPIVDFYQKHYEHYKEDMVIPFMKNNNLDVKFSKLKFRSKKKKTKEDTPDLSEMKFKKRTAGSILAYLSLILFLSGVLFLFVSSLGVGSGGMTEKFNSMFNSTVNNIMALEGMLRTSDFLEFFSGYLDAVIVWLEGFVQGLGNTVLNLVTSAGVGIINLIIALVIGFYIMNHKEKLTFQVKNVRSAFLSDKANTRISNILGDFHAVFSGYVRGLILDGIILGTMVGIGLSLVGVELAIVIGILTAIFNLIPFFGGIMAFFLSVTFELLMGSPINALYAAIVIIIIQQIDNVFIVPRVVGESVHLSPPTVMLSLSIAGTLFGLMGMLLVVPIIAIIKIFAVRFMERYRENHKNKDGSKGIFSDIDLN